MAQPFNVLKLTNEDVFVDVFGRPLNVGTPIALMSNAWDASFRTGRIMAYNGIYFQVGTINTASGVATYNESWPYASPNNMINIRALYDQQRFDEEEVIYQPHYDYRTSEVRPGITKRFMVIMVTDPGVHNPHISDIEIIVAQLPGSTTQHIEHFSNAMSAKCGKRQIGILTSRTQTTTWRKALWADGSETDTNWTAYKTMDRSNMKYGGTEREYWYTTSAVQSQFLLSKKTITEMGLKDYVDTIMSPLEYNDIVSSTVNQVTV